MPRPPDRAGHGGTRRVSPGLVCCVLLLAPIPQAWALELLSVATGRDGPAYLLRIEATFEAAPAQLLAVLTDYERIHELHPALLASRSLGVIGPDTEEVYTRFEGCVLLFCRTLHRVEHIRIVGAALVAVDVPGRGSFREGATEWKFSTTEQGTRLHYEARFVPAFRVTPILGSAVLARSVERMTVETMAEVERRAMQGHD